MGNFQGSVLGALLTLLGWDGTDFQNVKVDGSGHLQVDVLSNVLGGDQATETTLALVKDRLGALTTPAAGSTNKLLTDSLTELQLIKSLRNALHTVDLDMLVGYVAKDIGGWKELEIDTGGRLVVAVTKTLLPTNAATEESLQGIEDNIPDQLLGFTDTYVEAIVDLSAATGHNQLDSTSVPANELWTITSASMSDTVNNITSGYIAIVSGGTVVTLVRGMALLEGVGRDWTGRVILKEDDFIAAVFEGVTLNDDISLQLAGWKASV